METRTHFDFSFSFFFFFLSQTSPLMYELREVAGTYTIYMDVSDVRLFVVLICKSTDFLCLFFDVFVFVFGASRVCSNEMRTVKAIRRYASALAFATRCQPIYSNLVQHLAYTSGLMQWDEMRVTPLCRQCDESSKLDIMRKDKPNGKFKSMGKWRFGRCINAITTDGCVSRVFFFCSFCMCEQHISQTFPATKCVRTWMRFASCQIASSKGEALFIHLLERRT